MWRKGVVRELGSRIKDPDLGRLFENTFPNTLGEYFAIHERQSPEDIQIPPSGTLTR